MDDAVEQESLDEARAELPARFAGEHPIVVEGLRNTFGENVIHEDLSLTVNRGEIIGVVGGSGTGKSVLMRSIIGLQIPDGRPDRSAGRIGSPTRATMPTSIFARSGGCCSRAARCSRR